MNSLICAFIRSFIHSFAHGLVHSANVLNTYRNAQMTKTSWWLCPLPTRHRRYSPHCLFVLQLNSELPEDRTAS